MKLQEEITRQEKNVKLYKERYEDSIKRLEKLKTSTQPTNSELYENYKKFVNVEISQKDYTFILGGDGRSCPYDEKRNGLVCDVKIKNEIYLSDEQIKMIKDILKNTEKYDHLNIFE